MSEEAEMMEDMMDPAAAEAEAEDEVGKEVPLTPDGGVKKKILRAGSGWERPPKGCDVHVHYVGRLASDGTVFDSSRERGEPFVFKLGEGQVIKGWDEGVKTMKRGELAELTCAPEYAYGAASQGKIPANSTLVFEVELLSFSAEKDVSEAHDGGVLKKVLAEGEGYETPSDGTTATVRYTARVKATGATYDQSDAFTFVVGDEQAPVVGLDRAVASMKKGERALVTVAPKYGYGDAGCPEKSVPAGAELLLEVELTSFEKPKATYQMTGPELLEAAEARRTEGNAFYAQKRLRLAEKRYKAAIEALEAEWKMNEAEKATAKKAKVPCHLNLAAVALAERRWKDAREQCDKALALDATSVKARVRRAKALFAVDEWEDAERDLLAALETEPANADAKRELALVRKKVAEHDRAERKRLAGMFQRLSAMEEKEEAQRLAEEEARKKKEEEEKAKAAAEAPAAEPAPMETTPAPAEAAPEAAPAPAPAEPAPATEAH